jgi:hypothetical protein
VEVTRSYNENTLCWGGGLPITAKIYKII